MTLSRDRLLIAAYTVALVAACRLGSTVARRRVTRNAAVWLGITVVVVGLADVIENVLLGPVIDNPTAVGPWRIGAITSIVATKFVLLGIAAAFGSAAVVGTVLRLALGRRRHFIDKNLPQPMQTAPLPEPKQASVDRFEQPDGSGWWPVSGAGMCCSGGGIRSASFALGALQTMQRRSLLTHIDHLTTVSGGGYTGMSWQISRRVIVDRKLPKHPPPLAERSPESDYLAREARYLWPPLYRIVGGSIKWQRLRSTKSFLRTSAVAAASIAFNVGLLVTLVYLVACPVGWYVSSWAVSDADGGSRPEAWWQLPAALGQAGIVVLGLWPALVPWWHRMAKDPGCQAMSAIASVIATTGLVWVVLVVDGPWVVAGGALGVLAGLSVLGVAVSFKTRAKDDHEPSAVVGVLLGVLWSVAVIAVAMIGSGSGIGVPIGWVMITGGIVIAAMWTLRTKSASGAPGYPLALVPIGFLKLWVDSAFERGGGARQNVALHEFDVALRIAILLLTFLMVLAAGRIALTQPARRWMIGATIGLLVPSVALFTWRVMSSRLSPFLQSWLIVAAVVGLVACVIRTVRAERSGDRMATPSLNSARLVAGVSAAVLVTTAFAFLLWDDPPLTIGWTQPEWVRWAGWLLAALAVYIGLDQRWWSPHGMYKQRLAATFSPVRSACNEEPASPLPNTVVTTLSDWSLQVGGGPELTVCAAAYDTDRLRPPDIQALPFEFGARFVGSADTGWAHTADFQQALGRRNSGDGTLHAAAAVSGAAVSAAVGAVRKASLSQLIAFFNLRLGVWLPSPHYVAQLGDDDSGLGQRWITKRRYTYLLKELGSRYDLEDRFIYVTDGGQLENLGLYALLVRRCTKIYAFDASGDSDDTVNALTQSMDLARRRLGVAFSASTL